MTPGMIFSYDAEDLAEGGIGYGSERDSKGSLPGWPCPSPNARHLAVPRAVFVAARVFSSWASLNARRPSLSAETLRAGLLLRPFRAYPGWFSHPGFRFAPPWATILRRFAAHRLWTRSLKALSERYWPYLVFHGFGLAVPDSGSSYLTRGGTVGRQRLPRPGARRFGFGLGRLRTRPTAVGGLFPRG